MVLRQRQGSAFVGADEEFHQSWAKGLLKKGEAEPQLSGLVLSSTSLATGFPCPDVSPRRCLGRLSDWVEVLDEGPWEPQEIQTDGKPLPSSPVSSLSIA